MFSKKIDILVLKSFIGPYLMAFFIAEFVLIMQFLWKYIDNITGKGIGLFEILELVFYFSLTLIPMALPIAILLSSVFVFGNMSEKFELTSMKSSGVSFVRIIRMGIIIGAATCVFSIIASNYIVPKSFYMHWKGFDMIINQKPALSLEEGIFNSDFNNYKIYVGKKEKDGKRIKDILIYDQTDVNAFRMNMISADSGEMKTSPNGEFFIMRLYDGEQYRELKEKNVVALNAKTKTYPFIRTKFKEWEKVFDMSEFQLNENNFAEVRHQYDLMNTGQLLTSIDSIKLEERRLKSMGIYEFNKILKTKKFKFEEEDEELDDLSSKYIARSKKKTPYNKPMLKRIKQQVDGDISDLDHFYESFSNEDLFTISKSAVTKATHMKNQLSNNRNKLRQYDFNKAMYRLKLHQKYSWALICLVFLFIGASLGSIIRKGGYGFPLLLAIVFFMLFMVLKIMGEKLQRAGTVSPEVAAWLPHIILMPVALVATYKAVRDLTFDFSWIGNSFHFVKEKLFFRR